MSSDRLLTELLNRSKLLDYAIAHVETATALGGRPAQRDALKALYHTTQLFSLDVARLRARAEDAGIVEPATGYNDAWLVIPDPNDDARETRSASTQPDQGPSRIDEKPASAMGGEKILVVDPDERTRALAAAILGELGYRVHESRSGEEALVHLAGNGDEVHLLVTSEQLGSMTGAQLAESITTWHPRARVLYTQADAPLRPSELARKVREALAATSGGAFSAT